MEIAINIIIFNINKLSIAYFLNYRFWNILIFQILHFSLWADHTMCDVICVQHSALKPDSAVTAVVLGIFSVLSRTWNQFGCVSVSVWVFFVCIWPWHEGARRTGQRGAGWCWLASGHMVQSHHIAITGWLWPDSDTHSCSVSCLFPIPPPNPE